MLSAIDKSRTSLALIVLFTATGLVAANQRGTAGIERVHSTAEMTANVALKEGVVVGSDTSTISDPGDTGYGKPNQTRIWYNSHRSRWDALVPINDNGDSASDHYIVKDVNGTQVFTDVELENRNTARPDAFWADAARRLYVLGSHATLPRFTQVTYDEAGDTYAVVPDVDAVEVPGLTHLSSGGENRPATLYVSPNGRIWASIMKDDELLVQHSTDGGRTWRLQPVLLATDVRLGVTTWSHFRNQGRTYVGLFTGENGEDGIVVSRYDYWYIDQDDDPANQANWVREVDAIPAPLGVETSDDHVHASRDAAGNQYFVVKTEAGAPTDPVIKLFRRTPAGTWSQYPVVQAQVEPEQTRPSAVIDAENGEIHVYTTGTGGGRGQRRVAPLDELDLLGTVAPESVFVDVAKRFDDINTPRGPVNSETDLVLLAHSELDKTVWYSEETIPAAPDVDPPGGPCGIIGGTPERLSVQIPQTGGSGSLNAMVYRPDSTLQPAPCPLISMVPGFLGGLPSVDWGAERLARDGYVVIVTAPQVGTLAASERALRSGIDYMLSAGNPWPSATDTEHVGILAGPVAAQVLGETQQNDLRVDAVVAWDNLSSTTVGDRGAPTCSLLPGPNVTPRVPAMGQASDVCLRRREAKKTAFDWWRANGVESMEVVFRGSTVLWWGPLGSSANHDRIHYYTLAWFDRWLKNDSGATARLMTRQVLGKNVGSLLDNWYESAAFVDGYDCGNLRSACPAP